MKLHDYMTDVREQIELRSAAMRRDYSHHNPSAGANREDIVKEFLTEHLPAKFGVKTGFACSLDGGLSNEPDLLIVDVNNNAPFYGGMNKEIWPIEAIYAMIEVKTKLTPDRLKDAINKGVRFKKLRRDFFEPHYAPNPLKESLVIVWAFESADFQHAKTTVLEQMRQIPIHHRPDIIIVVGKFIMVSGELGRLCAALEPDSEELMVLDEQEGRQRNSGRMLYAMRESPHVLLTFLCWLHTWLVAVGPRIADLSAYAEAENHNTTTLITSAPKRT